MAKTTKTKQTRAETLMLCDTEQITYKIQCWIVRQKDDMCPRHWPNSCTNLGGGERAQRIRKIIGGQEKGGIEGGEERKGGEASVHVKIHYS